MRFILALCCAGMVFLQGCDSGPDTRENQTPAPPADTTPPTAPQNLTATAVSPTRIDLAWSASTDAGGIASYRIHRNGSATPLTSVTGTSFADTTVVPNTTYSYVVHAVDQAGNVSPASNSASATTPPASSGSSGLDARPTNTSCLAWPRPTSSITLQQFTSLNFSSPVAMLQAPGQDTHWYVVEQGGRVRRFATANPSGTLTTFVDLTSRVVCCGERGLLGMAFHPDFPTDARVFLSYTGTEGSQLVSRISSFISSDGGATLDPASETVLLTVDQPATNHNGGHIAFGPDGYLYIGLGDGGSGGDPWGTNGNGQRLTTLLGKLLRIDVDAPAGVPYTVPATNPFFDPANPNDRCPAAGRSSGNCPEIYAWGLRNPWRFSFDRVNGDLWLADVGQNFFEEVNRVTLGGNYGWRCREGAHDFNTAGTPACAGAALIDPLIEYGRSLGASITGGFVYRGQQATALVGRYLFADFVSGNIFTWIPENASSREPTLLLDSGFNVSSFAQGNDGELYVLNYGGTLHRIVFSSGGGTAQIPETLSATGCVDPANPSQPNDGLIGYAINAPFWSDGATKERWIALPNTEEISRGGSGDWNLPAGTVLMKHFRRGNRLLETRLLMRHPDGVWGGYSYEWNAQQTDATLVRGGAQRVIDGQPWIFPSEAQCAQCHTNAAGRSLGLETAQMNRDFTYAQTNRTANQLTTLSAIGVLTPPVADASAEPAMPDPMDTSAPLAERARAYLHANCSNCHRPGGPT
ncbi:MAG TPA: PQQ-dependent sugar dehydrogenase, partial [Steroidobacteraceae bacterium]